MNITTENINDLNVLVKIDIASDDYMPKVENSIKDYSKKLNLKGFRKGKVPPQVVKKMYGTEIVAEELNKLVNENLSNYLKENKIQILGDPLPKEDGNIPSLDVNNPQDQQFVYELGLQPEIKIDMIETKAEVERYDIQLDDAVVNEEIERLQKRYGKMTNPEDIQENDVVYVELKELDENGAVKDGCIENKPAIPLEELEKSVRENVMALKKDESITIDVNEAFAKDKSQISQRFFNIPAEKLNEGNNQYQLTLKNVNRIEKAELNEEFFNKIYGEGTVTTEEEFRNKVKEELSEVLKINADRKLNNDIAEKLLDETNVELPDDFLKRWLKQTNPELSEQEIDEEYDPFVRNLKWSLIVNKLLEAGNINVERKDIEDRTKELIKMEYGLGGEDEGTQAYLNEFTNHLMKNEEHVRKIFDNIRDQKIFEYIKEQITIKDKNISYSEFKELQ